MSTAQISGLTDALINQMRTKAVVSGYKVSTPPAEHDEILKVKLIYDLVILSDQFRQGLHEFLGTSDDDDEKFRHAIEQAEREAEAIIWMYYHPNSTLPKPPGNYYYSEDKQYASTLQPVEAIALNDRYVEGQMQLRILKRIVDNRVQLSTVHLLENGLPLFPFVCPIGIFSKGECQGIKQSLELKDAFDWNDEKLFEISKFRDIFMSMTFKQRPAPAQDTKKEEEEDQDDDDEESSEEEESDDDDEAEEAESIKDESEAETQPSSPPPEEAAPPTSKPDPPPPSPPPQEAEDENEGSPPRGTGRYNARNWRRKRDHSSEREDDETPANNQSTDQQGDKRSESPASDQDDIDEHFLDDLHERAREYINQFNNWDELPEPQDHSKRFEVEDDAPQEVSSADVTDDDIVISVNDSSRSIRFVLTFDESTRKPIFNKIRDPRRNRYS